MDSEEVDGIGNGSGFMEQDLVSLNFTQKSILFRSKDG